MVVICMYVYVHGVEDPYTPTHFLPPSHTRPSLFPNSRPLASRCQIYTLGAASCLFSTNPFSPSQFLSFNTRSIQYIDTFHPPFPFTTPPPRPGPIPPFLSLSLFLSLYVSHHHATATASPASSSAGVGADRFCCRCWRACCPLDGFLCRSFFLRCSSSVVPCTSDTLQETDKKPIKQAEKGGRERVQSGVHHPV
jgi:hypothetical protein